MRISSPEFQNNEMIPSRFTCQGQDISPALEFSDVPKNVQSFVLVVDDPDAPMGTWVHWVLFNIPPDVREIAEDSAPENAVQGRNSWSKNSYGGPCPPLGTHRYFFKLYALNMTLDLDSTAVKGDVEEAMQEYVLDKAQLIGLYERE